jgi:hypothetical protein
VMGGRKGGNAEEGGAGYRVVQGVLTFSSSAQRTCVPWCYMM